MPPAAGRAQKGFQQQLQRACDRRGFRGVQGGGLPVRPPRRGQREGQLGVPRCDPVRVGVVQAPGDGRQCMGAQAAMASASALWAGPARYTSVHNPTAASSA